MKNKNGFTLVELLGVIVILGMVLGIVGLAYTAINAEIRNSYYKTLEESILLGANDYYNFNKNSKPSLIGEIKKVSLEQLVENKYLTNVLDKNKESCDLMNSHILSIKSSKDKIDYYVCLSCPSDNYKTANDKCEF